MLLSQGKDSFGDKTSIYVKLNMLLQVAGFKANFRAPFGHKQSFWLKQVCYSNAQCMLKPRWKQACCNGNKYVSMLLKPKESTFGDKQAFM